MHFLIYAMFDHEPTEKDIESVLAPFQEKPDVAGEHDFWDWWSFGGRWKGIHGKDKDVCPINEMTAPQLPYGFIANGELVKSVSYGSAIQVDKDYEKKYHEALGQHSHIAVVDCHG